MGKDNTMKGTNNINNEFLYDYMKDKFAEIVDNQKENSSNFKEIFHRLDVIETKAATNADIVSNLNRRNWKLMGLVISVFILSVGLLRLFGVSV